MKTSPFPRLTRITSSNQFIPEIDGFRFLAISMVVCSHIVIVFLGNAARGASNEPIAGYLAGFAHRGVYGVEFFFVISGFILSLPFARHYLQAGKPVPIGKFYLRRLSRLEPPYLLSLAGLYAAAFLVGKYLTGQTEMPADQFLPSFLSRVLYSHGLIYGEVPHLNGVTWSLEVEVQFYLLVPLLTLVFKIPATARRLLMLAIVFLMPWIAWKTLLAKISITAFFQYFIAGFLLADLYLEKIEANPRRSVWADLLALAALLAIMLQPAASFDRPKLLAPLIFAFYLLAFQSVYLRRFFVDPRFCVIGGMCYSIYLLHYPLLVALDRLVWKLAPSLGFVPGLLVFASIAIPTIAMISVAYFVLLERPCMDSRWPAQLWKRLAMFGRGSGAARLLVKPSPDQDGRKKESNA